MIRKMLFLTILLVVCWKVDSQRVAPGVPPQHYQQQGYQQQQPQYAQHQAPVQPQYQQQQYQQPQQQQMHNMQPSTPVANQEPYLQQQQPQQQQVHQQQQQQQQYQQHGQPQKVLNAANIEHEREHIQEHMAVPIDTSKMSEAELQFHYFKMHDSDNNNKLDGCELIKSLIHWHEADSLNKHGNDHDDDDHHKEPRNQGPVSRTDETLINMIDPVLDLMDLDKDGYISWTEYKTSADTIT